jgi:hypothetical protein
MCAANNVPSTHSFSRRRVEIVKVNCDLGPNADGISKLAF